MAKSKTSYGEGNKPDKKRKPRGPAERTKILGAFDRSDYSEEQFYDKLVMMAMTEDDSFALKELLIRMDPIKKSVMPYVDFSFKSKSSPTERVGQIIDAAASSKIPPDIAVLFIQAVKYACDIEESTELKDRIEALEELAK